MSIYRVTWEIDLEAETPREAAEKALAIQRNPDSIATVFDVRRATNVRRVDLTEDTEDVLPPPPFSRRDGTLAR